MIIIQRRIVRYFSHLDGHFIVNGTNSKMCTNGLEGVKEFGDWGTENETGRALSIPF